MVKRGCPLFRQKRLLLALSLFLCLVTPSLASAGDFSKLFERAARAERTLYQMETVLDLTFFLLSEDYKKEHGIEAYYEAVFSANDKNCFVCGHKLEKGKK